MTSLFTQTVEAYRLSGSAEVRADVVRHEQVEQFVRSLTALEMAVRDVRDDPFWAAVTRRFRICRFDMAATPLPLNHPVFGQSDAGEYLLQAVSRCADVFPAQAELATRTLNDLLGCFEVEDDPLGDRVRRLIEESDGGPLLMLTRKDRYHAALEERFGGRVGCITARDLPQLPSAPTACAIGPLSWFPEVANAPRADVTTFIRYAWMKEHEVATGILRGGVSGLRDHVVDRDAQVGLSISSDDVLPRVSWDAVQQRMRSVEIDNLALSETALAYTVLLGAGLGTYIDAAPRAMALLLDPAGLRGQRIVRARTQDIVADSFLLLRSDGAGDYVEGEADRLLGDQAEGLRRIQRSWKDRFRKTIADQGLGATVARLRELGASRASEVNVQYWVWPRSLRTGHRDDFAAIMRLIGWTERSDEIWLAMGRLDVAHMQAGQHVRAQLLAAVRDADISARIHEDSIDFRVPGIAGGSITAFRVEERSPESTRVPWSRINRLVRLERELWQG